MSREGYTIQKLPKLKIKLPYSHPDVEICSLEEAKYRLSYGQGVHVVVDGHAVNSYDELVSLAEQNCYREKEFIEVLILPMIGGG
jgi:hypothetical protein